VKRRNTRRRGAAIGWRSKWLQLLWIGRTGARAVMAQACPPPESFEVDVSSYGNLDGKAVNSRTGIAKKDEATWPGTSSGTFRDLAKPSVPLDIVPDEKRRAEAGPRRSQGELASVHATGRASVGCSSNRRDR
jgi:hypothetical protein